MLATVLYWHSKINDTVFHYTSNYSYIKSLMVIVSFLGTKNA